MREFALIDRYFKPVAGNPGARGLADDAAVIAPPAGRDLVITKDMIASGVHFLPDDPADTVAAKLLAVNLSDLAAMGAQPLGCVLGLGLPARVDEAWVAAFAQGLGAATRRHGCPLLGGDTIAGLDRPVLSLTAFGHVAPGAALARAGARAGDDVWVSGTIGEARNGLRILRDGHDVPEPQRSRAITRYRMPEPRLALGQVLTGLASAASDVSDGVLADARNIAAASAVRMVLRLPDLPCSEDRADDPGRLAAATAGDDYELLFCAPPSARPAMDTLSQTLGLRLTRIGTCEPGEGLVVLGAQGAPITLTRLGHEHEMRDVEEGSSQAR